MTTSQAHPRHRAPTTMVQTASGWYRWGSVTPVVLLVALFTLFPLAYALLTSLHRVILTQPDARPFVGVENYAKVLGEAAFINAAQNTLWFAGVSVPLVTAAGLAVALLLNQRVRGFGVLRVLVLLPWSIPLVSAGIMWRLLLHGNFGALNGALVQLGLIDSYAPWLSSPKLAMWSVIVVHIWREFPLAAILFLAGLQTIPNDLVDAAKMDGAGAWSRFRYVILPLLKGPLLIVLVYETMIAIAVFDLVYVLTGGGPGSATTLISWFAYAVSFKFLNLGQGAALSFLISGVILVLIVAYLRIIRLQEDVL
ncbi:MAG: carbohydrate ABC transporter permease [Actinomycetota bacterium]